MIEVDERHTTTLPTRPARAALATVHAVEGYDDTTYGAAFADVYDEWYAGVSDVDTTVATLLDLAGVGRVLELGVGTGRLALPLARAGRGRIELTGVDTSAEMLSLLSERDADGLVTLVTGDMVAAMPDGPFTLVFVAYNTLFNLPSADQQRACFAAVADRLTPGGRFVVEAFVPDDPPRDGDAITLRSMSADRVVLSVARHHADLQTAEGQFVELTEAGGVRLRPWSIRYSTPGELDAMATAVGLTLEHRWLDMARREFDDDADRHVTVYRQR